ncbi:calcium-activated chloride channel regulator 1 [Anolis carolinensis]|uniref:VWFA domain-containing protein n=1 Tax=Anolis carolinensis TaxID=28377 RepID=G1K9X4_ANOCA|nr:PREDICTED: epithelial chloride channel protein [Anolis carolinensis]|eukprot:XP_003220165.1 PREDICTED: epithelial chloride channel protein [Anolis carolinensis]
MLLNQCHLLMGLMLLHEVKGTMVKLNNGGFEDIVIAINPGLSEDNKIINSIKDMVKQASAYLFNATRQRFYFKTVKIVIPQNWMHKPEYKRVTRESYNDADVIVADPFLKYGDEPYTLQYGGCGEPGRYIHFTPNFLTNDSLLVVYGPRGRIFVHEWAHLRWGVFDEYNNDAPFYTTGKYKAEATRCSSEITGQYVFQTKTGSTRKCKMRQQNHLYESECLFLPDKEQTTSASIMYMQALPSVTQFCDMSNHNVRAPNLQNKICNFKSTWEVIMDSTDFAHSSSRSTPPPDPTISLLQMQERIVCLVLDVSGSMSGNNRIARLKQAAETFILQNIEDGSWVGIVTFNNAATIQTGLQQVVSDTVRKTLNGYLPISANGGTNICAGVQKGFQVFSSKYASTEGCEIVLLTDGEDSGLSSCFAEVQRSGSVIHTIALGPSAAKELEMLADMTGGLKFSATDSVDSSSLEDAFSGISSGSRSISLQSLQIESKGQSIGPKSWMYGTVSIDKTVGNDTFFAITWSVSMHPPGIHLTDPRGKNYTTADFVVENSNLKTARLKIPGTAEAGDWSYSIQNTESAAQVLSITVTSRAASATVPPITVKSYMSRDTNKFPNPTIIYAEVTQGFSPVIGVKVIAKIESASGKTTEIELLDNGSGADILRHDGIYSRYFTAFKENGRHNIKVSIQGKDKTAKRTRRHSHTLYIPGYIEDGKIKMNPPKPEPNVNETQGNMDNFSRIASGGSFLMTDVPAGYIPDVFPPCKITDLRVELTEEDEFHFFWTAPGNDFDVGKAERYEIKTSINPLELRQVTFHHATSLNTSALIPEVAGIKQSFQYKAENFTKENGTSIYFAIRAIDDSNNIGEVSNIAMATVLFPQLLEPPSNNEYNKIVTIVVITICSFTVVCAIISIIICVLKKRKMGDPKILETA